MPNATYRNHGTHAEAIEIVFDPKVISYRALLENFFQLHDPTTPNRQGNDRGMSYRSAIFYTTPEQKQVAEETIADVDASGLWPGKVVTEVAAAGPFWQAEPEHQDYLQRIPYGYTCHFVRSRVRSAMCCRCCVAARISRAALSARRQHSPLFFSHASDMIPACGSWWGFK